MLIKCRYEMIMYSIMIKNRMDIKLKLCWNGIYKKKRSLLTIKVIGFQYLF